MDRAYPRPQMRRERYQLLDGEWRLNGQPVRIPYPPEAPLSGYQGKPGPELTYEKAFTVPADWTDCRILLHFGAVDQKAAVYLNGSLLGNHEGGYLPFTFDITDRLRDQNSLLVFAEDWLSHDYPYGKQSKNPHGMWYTPVSGIWQSVWLEPVPRHYLKKLRLTPDMEGVLIEARDNRNGRDTSFTVQVLSEEERDSVFSFHSSPVLHFEGGKGYLNLKEYLKTAGIPGDVRLWSPSSPVRYRLRICAGSDSVETCAGLRRIEIRSDDGIPGVYLNNNRIFLHGVLDQGYFPEGIFVPGSPEAYEQDILRMKALGFNLLRKHIKIEPEQFYEACDCLGMLVLQDMVNSGPYHYLRDTVLPTVGVRKRPEPLFLADTFRKRFFIRHMMETIRQLYNHPCIIGYTIFNEGWGQFSSDRLYEIAKKEDPHRLIDTTSGWFAEKKSDFDSRHVYFSDRTLRPGGRPMLLSECGGFGLSIADLRNDGSAENLPEAKKSSGSYSYGTCSDSEALTDRILKMYQNMVLPAIPRGLCGAVYTQLSDVESEINGLYTYDRKICKVIPEKMQELAELLGEALKG